MYSKNKILFSIIIAALSFARAASADITTGLVLDYPFDETNSAVAHDAGPNAINGNLTGFPDNTSGWTTNGRIAGALLVNTASSTNEYISIPNSTNVNFDTGLQFSLSAWVNLATTAQISGAAIICKGTGGGGEQYTMDMTGGKFRFYVRNSTGSTATQCLPTLVPASNTWYHVVAVFNISGANKIMQFFINGAVNGTQTPPTSMRASTSPVTIGDRQSSTSAFNLPFKGMIDDVHIYNRALSTNDVLQLYLNNSGVTLPLPVITNQPRSVACYVGDIPAFLVGVDQTTQPVEPASYQWQFNGTNIAGATTTSLAVTNAQVTNSGNYTVVVTNVGGATTSSVATLTVQSLPAADITDNLVGYWKFDDGSGSATAADATTNADTGTLSGFADGTDTAMWTTNGLIGGALIFNADNTFNNVVAVPSVGNAAPAVLDFASNPVFTLAAWVNGSAAQSSGAAIFGHGLGNGGEQYVVDVQGGKFRFYVRNPNGTTYTALSTVAPSGVWQHVAAVLNATNGIMNLYVNGQLAAVGIAPFSLTPAASAHEMTIGNRQNPAGIYTNSFTGKIDEVHVYNRDLTSADVQALYLAGGAYPPTMATQPQSASLYVGDNLKLTAVAGGTAPLAYQWTQNGTNISGATNTSLSFIPTVAANAGNYTLVATNLYGSTTSLVATVTLTPFTPTNALAGYWTFDDGSGSSTAADSSTNGNTANLNGFPDFTSEWIAGRVGTGAINFNNGGTGQYVDVPNSSSLNFSTNLHFSLAAWVRGPASQISGACIICKGVGSLNEEYSLDVNAGTYRFYLRNAASAVSTITTTIAPNGTWQHLVATYDGALGVMVFYLNGVPMVTNAAAATTLLADNGHDVSIGAREGSLSTGYNLYFVGAIDDARIYNRTLSTADALAVYQSTGIQAPVFYTQPQGASLYVSNHVTFSAIVDGTAPLAYQWTLGGSNISGATASSLIFTNLQLSNAGTYNLVVTNAGGTNISQNAVLQVGIFGLTNMVGYWKFDETNGSTAFDSTTNGNNGTLINFPGDDSEWVSARLSNGLIFDTNGSQTYVSVPDSANLNFSNILGFTLAAWVRGPASQANGAGVIAKGTGGGGEQYCLDIHSDLLPAATYRIFVRSATGPSTIISTPVSPNGRWQHLVATYDGFAGTLAFYVNGQLVGSNLTAPTSLLPSSHAVTIGDRESSAVSGYNLPFQGILDDVRIYNQALSPALVQSLYQLAPPLALVFYSQPQGGTNYTGYSTTFTAVADGVDPLSYQWFKNSSAIPGATNVSLTLTNLAVTDSGNYTLLVTNATGSLLSSNAALLVLPVNFSSSPLQLSDGTFQLNFTGPPNGSYRIFSTTDITLPFNQWMQLTGGGFDGNGQATFTDSNATNYPAQFYRISVP